MSSTRCKEECPECTRPCPHLLAVCKRTLGTFGHGLTVETYRGETFGARKRFRIHDRRWRLSGWIPALVPGPSLVPCGAYANTRPIKAAATDNPAIPDWSSIKYTPGLLYGQIENVPLGKVLSELARKSGVQVHLTDPVIAQWSVSASLEGVSFVEGIKRILDGFSYATYRGADISGIIVLSTQPDPALSRARDWPAGRPEDGMAAPVSGDDLQPAAALIGSQTMPKVSS